MKKEITKSNIFEEIEKINKKEIMSESNLIEIKSLFDFDTKNLRHYINQYKYKFNRNYNIIINMELLNGEFQTFYVKANYKGFLFRGKRYIIDTTFKYYSQTFKNYILDFHEEFCLPIERKIMVKEIRDNLNIQSIQVRNMINPHILEQFTKSDLAEGILKGNKLNAILNFIKIWVLISAIGVIIMVFLYMYNEGMLKNLGI